MQDQFQVSRCQFQVLKCAMDEAEALEGKWIDAVFALSW